MQTYSEITIIYFYCKSFLFGQRQLKQKEMEKEKKINLI